MYVRVFCAHVGMCKCMCTCVMHVFCVHACVRMEHGLVYVTLKVGQRGPDGEMERRMDAVCCGESRLEKKSFKKINKEIGEEKEA